jgi:hypothetical protein
MTEPVVCRKGRCEYKDKTLNEEWNSDCRGCDIVESIEHDVQKSAVKGRRRSVAGHLSTRLI